MTSQDIAEAVRRCRRQSGLSQAELAKLAGVGKTALFDLEKGKESIQLNTLFKILNTLNIRIHLEAPFTEDKTS